MPQLITRSSFLRGRFQQESAPLPPPWALSEHKFAERCSRCNDCLDACPEGIIQRGGGGYPEISFDNGACTFCALCGDACETGALMDAGTTVDGARAAPWSLVANIGNGCLPRRGIECRVCQDQCETGAVVFRPTIGGPGIPEIKPSQCTGCGACVAPCPEQAITILPPGGA